jgi:hypothetical protein
MATDPIVRTYDPKLVIATFGGIIFTGYAEGSFIQVAGNGDKFEKSRGADGTVDRINKNAFDYSITITLKQTSLTNDAMSAVLNADLISNAGKFPFTLKDLNGTTLLSAAQAWIRKDPDDEYSDSLGTRQWILDTGIAAKVTGGNIL